MTLRALFDEGRRKELREALRTGRQIEFRRKAPDTDNGRIDPKTGRMNWWKPSDEELAGKGYVPRLSDADRVIGGDLVMKGAGGKMIKIGPKEFDVRFPGRDDLTAAFARLRSTNNPAEWQPFIDEIVKWEKDCMGNSDEKRAAVSAALFHYSNATGDSTYWEGGSK